MFFIFGTRKSKLRSYISESSCNYCNTEKSIIFSVFQNYFHVFWIPLFPLWKEVRSSCIHCKQNKGYRDFSSEMKANAILYKNKSKTPIYTYIILLIVFTLFIISIITHSI